MLNNDNGYVLTCDRCGIHDHIHGSEDGITICQYCHDIDQQNKSMISQIKSIIDPLMAK